MFPGARSSASDHVKRPRANLGAENVQARVVIPFDDPTARRIRATSVRAHRSLSISRCPPGQVNSRRGSFTSPIWLQFFPTESEDAEPIGRESRCTHRPPLASCPRAQARGRGLLANNASSSKLHPANPHRGPARQPPHIDGTLEAIMHCAWTSPSPRRHSGRPVRQRAQARSVLPRPRLSDTRTRPWPDPTEACPA